MRLRGLAAVVAALVLAGDRAAAQAPFVSKPVDLDKLVVQPTDAIAGVTAKTTLGTIRTFTRSAASAIENNGYVKTVNNLFGRRANPPAQVQAGFSPLPTPATFRSSSYANSFVPPAMLTSTYGSTPSIPVRVGPSSQR